MKRIFLWTLLAALSCLYACGNGSKGSSSLGQVEGYDLVEYSNSILKAYKKSGERIIEEGTLIGGIKTGSWIVYHPDMRPKIISHFVQGKLDGPYYEMSVKGQIDKLINYKEDKLHGESINYRFGRTQESYNYKNGELDGMHKVFHGNGKIQKEVEYKNGLQDGVFRYYDEEGNITLDYIYKDGEKVSGGIIEVQKEVDEK